MGSTEAGAYFIEVRNKDNWEYYRFRPSMGLELEWRTENLYELVFRRRPDLERWQQLFKVYPDIDEYPTKDLWAKHPSEPDLWRYAGRSDDLIILSNAYNVDASAMEADIQRSPNVKCALIGGQGKPHPFLIVELFDDVPLSRTNFDSKLNHLWPFIERANDQCPDGVKLAKGRIILTDAEKPFPRTAKATVARQPSFALYISEIDRLYE